MDFKKVSYTSDFGFTDYQLEVPYIDHIKSRDIRVTKILNNHYPRLSSLMMQVASETNNKR